MKKFLSLFLFAILFCGSAMAYDFSAVCSSGQTLYYTITSSTSPYTVEVVTQNSSTPYYTTKPTGDLVIPSSVTYNSKTYSVTSIGYSTFANCSGLASVTIPNSVTSIGIYAIARCIGLTSVTIPNSVTSIGNYAFENCSRLTTVNFNATNCTTMGSLSYPVFSSCTSLSTLNIGENVTNIPDYAFYGCSGLTEITIPSSVASIGSYAFYGCSGLTEITIPSSVTSIGNYAFSRCSSLGFVSIGKNVESIGERAFYDCSELTTFNFNAENCMTMGSYSSPVFYNCTSLSTLNIGENVTNIPDYAFYGCSGLTEITIPSSVTSIGNYAFSRCSSLGFVSIGKNVESIGERAFYDCSELTTFNFNAENCMTMGSYSSPVFYNCTSLSTLNIGENVTNIPNYAFYGCSGLTDIYANPTTPPTTQTNAFNNYTATVYVPCGSAEAYRSATGWSNFSNISVSNPYIASGTCGADGDNLTWTLSCDSVLTISGSGAMADYSSTGAPWYGDYRSKIKTLVIDNGVTSIGIYAFYGCNGLTSVTIPNSVTSISDGAFYNCSGLTSVTIPNSVASIGSYAFQNCSGLTSVTIPNSVTNIGYYAFSACSGLTTVNFNATNCTTMGNSVSPVFNNCTSLSTLNIGENVTNIPAYAFSGCSGLTSVTIPNSVTSIGNRAFNGCSGLITVNYNATNCTTMGNSASPVFNNCTSLSTLNIGENVTNIPAYAFQNCSGLTSVTIPNSVTSIGDRAFSSCSGLTTVNFNATNCTTMGHSINQGYSFYGCNANATINIGSDVNIIPDYAFMGLLGNGTLTIPNSVTSIGDFAFYGCSGLTSVTIPNSVTSIGNDAFSSCSGLTSVTIPNSVTSIGNRAFNGCSGLTTVYFNATNCTSMSGSSVWNGCSSLSTLNIGENVTNIPNNAFQNCSGLTTITIPDSVAGIGSYAFQNCSGLTSVTIPNSVTNIGNYAFSACSGLTTVNFNATNCTSMPGNSVWNGCSSLSTLNIGENVTNIPNNAFQNCSGLTTITIPDSVASIGSYAFQNCSGLTSVTIPNSVTNIGNYAFSACSGLTTVNFNATNCTTMGNSSNPAFSGCTSLATLNIGDNVTNIPNYAFSNCSGLTEVTIPNSVTSIGYSAFYNCSGLTTINFNATNCTTMGDSNSPVFNGCTSFATLNIGESVTNIPAYAFLNCSGLTSVTIPNSVTSIGNYAFARCSGLAEVTIPTSITSIGNYAFQNCSGLTTITIPDSVASIGSYAFSGCSGLEDVRYNARNAQGGTSSSFPSNLHLIYLGDSVESIGNYMFYECTFLDSIVSAAVNPPAMNARTFYFVNIPNVPVIVPCRCVAAYEGADYWNNFNTVRQAFGCIQEYTITVVSANPDFGSVSGSGTYEQGTEVAISATPATHYHFVQWNDGNTDNPRTITVTADATYTAEFAIVQHTITALSANGTMGSVSGGGTYTEGTTATLTANANAGYRFSAWNDNNTDNPRMITVTGDAIFIATFETLPQHTITVLANNDTYGTVDGGGTFTEGTEIQISAVPNENYIFIQWNDGNTDNPRSITVTENATYTAQFDVQHTIRYNATAEATGNWVMNNTNTSRNTWDSNTGDGMLYLKPGVTTIGGGNSTDYSPFYNNSNLVSVDLGNSGLTNIGRSAFQICNELESITIPNSTTSIGRDAFYRCNGLTLITIGNSVTSIEQSAFLSCDNLDAVYYTSSIAQWCEITFGDNYANPLYYAHNLYINNNLVDNLVIPNSVTEIKDYAFNGATCLTSVTIGPSVMGIGISAFYGCSGLTSVYYTGSIAQWCGITFGDYWGSNPLAYAHKLYVNNELITNLVIPETVTEIKDYAFYSCNSLTSVTIPNSVTSIGRSAFYNCSHLSPITIGNSVASIGQSAFAGCYIYDIYANPTTPPSASAEIFTDYGYNATLWVPCGSAEAYRTADIWSNFSNINERGTYNLDVSSANPQQGSASVTQQPNCSDGTALITATPIENFRFVHWNDGNTDNPRTIMVTQDTAFVAVFEEHPQYTITVHSANTNQGSVAGNGTYAEGTEVSISATAYEHNHFVSWNDGNTDNPRIITVTEDAMYIATFAIDQFTIAVSANDYVMGTVSGTGTYNYGTERQISAAPSAHYHFVSWNDGNTDNPRTITITQNATYTARFAIDQHTITVASSNTSMGTASGGGTYDYGASRQISASPSAHYHFVQWNDGNTTNPRTINVTADATYTAEFAIDEFTVTVSANNNYMGTVAGGGTYDYGTELQISAVPATCNRFVQWNDGNTESPRTITVVGNTSYTAVFETYQLTVSLSAEQIACNGGTANIINAVEGGTVPYNYAWSNGSTSQDITGADAGTYSITVTDNNGCEATASTTITEPEPLTVSVLSNDPLCLGNSTMITSSVAGGTTPYSYAWSNGETAAVVSVAAEGAYSLTVTDANNCTSASSVNIPGYEIVASIAMSSDEFSDGIYYYNACAGGSIEMNGIIQSGTVDSWRWYINPHNGNSSVFTTQNVTYTPTDALAHDITLTAMDEHGCPVVAQGRIRVSGGLAVPTLVSPAEGGICQGSERIITIGETEGSGIQVSGSYIEALPDYKVNNDTSFLPDGNNTCYNTSLVFDMFADGETVTSVDDIDRIYINMEHSYLGDLSMMIQCPNGQQCLLHANKIGTETMPSLNWTNNGGINNSGSLGGGSPTYPHLGLSPDPSSSSNCYYTAGEGYSYYFTPTSTTPFGSSGPTTPITYTDSCGNTERNNVLNEGDYATYESMSSLIGCPLNGEWTLYVCDHLTLDNGWIFEWGLFFREDLYTATWGYDVYAVSTLVESNSIGASDFSNANGAGLMIAPPTNLSGEQHVNINVVDNLGCITSTPIEVDFDVTAPFDAVITGNTNVCDGAGTTLTAVTNGGVAPFAYNWNTAETTASISPVNITGTVNYNVSVIDASGCTGTAETSVLISNPTVSMSSVAVNCHNGNDGTATATITNGNSVAPYTYTWSDGTTATIDQTSHSITVPAGTYDVTVSDAGGCSATGSVVVSQPVEALTASLSAEEINCNGETTEIITAVEGGTAPYNYAWSNGETSQNLTGDGAGTYSITVTDNNGCEATANANITEPEPLTVSVLSNDPLCLGNSTKVTSSVAGGTAPYSYAWSNGETAAVVSVSAEGAYSLTVTDANNCTSASSVNITGYEIVASIAMSSDEFSDGIYYYNACAGGSVEMNGIIQSGTVDSWRWYINPHNGNSSVFTTQNVTYTPTDALAHDITLTAMDEHGCPVVAQGRIRVSGGLAVPTLVSPAEGGICQGSERIITIGETEGSGIQVSGSYIEALPDYKVNNDTTFLPDGTGECYSTSIDLDMFADGATVTSIDDIDRIYINMEHSYLGDISMMIRCPNGQTCLLKAHSNSSTSAITMPSLNWTNSGGINNSGSIGGGTTHLGLSPDPSDSTSFCYYTIGEGYSYNFTPTATLPFGSNGPKTSTPYRDQCGNTETIQVLNEGDYATYESMSSLIGCPLNGTWTIYVCDHLIQDNGYIFEWGLFFREDLYPATWGYDVYAVSTLVESNSLGVSDYSDASGAGIMIAPPANSSGNNQHVNIQVVDNFGCISSSHMEVDFDVTAPFDATITGKTNVCDGAGTTLTAVADGGVAPFLYNWNTAETTASISPINITEPVSYNVSVIDASGCTGTAETSVLISNPTVSMSSVAVNCHNGNDGTATATITNGNSVAPYTYTWSDGTTATISQASHSITVPTGTYDVTVSDAGGCSATGSVVVSQPVEALTASLSAEEINCNGETTEIITAVEGGTVPYAYSWSNDATSQNLTGVVAGTYSVTITDRNGCEATASTTITEPEPLTVSLSAETIQYNGGTTDIINTVAGGTMPYTYAWSNGETSQNLESVVAGTYSVTVTDNNGCIATESVFLTEPELFTIVVSSSDDAMGTVNGSGTYDEGTEIAISATSAVHCHFVQWNDGNTDNPRTIVVIEDATYTAEFAFDQYTITILSANGAMGTVSESGTYDYGTEIEISAIPSEHHHFVSWSDGNTENPRIVTVTEDVMYIATFAIDQFAITVTANDYTMGTVSGGGIYNYGSERQIYASPYAHYRFVQWSDGNTDNPRTINVTADATYTAEFEIGQITITVSSSNEEMGTVSGSGSYDYGAEIQISAIAAEHHHFVQWNDGNTENPRAITVTEDATFIAEFAIDQFTVSVVSENETMGTVSGGGTYDYSSTILISATPVEHYHFVQWNDGNTENPRTVIVTENVTYTASFAIGQITITATSADETMGTVYGGGSYGYGAEIQITATATEHYHFVQWSDGSTENPRMVIVTEDATYIATFAIDWYTINVTANNATMGTVSGGGTYEYNTEIQISASAIEHHHFVQWNDGNTDNPRTISVTDDATYTAEFAIDQFVVAVVSANDMMGFVSGNGSYDYGSEIQITAEANEHYHFVSWNDGNTDNPRNITVTENVTYTAEFAIDQFTIAVVSENNAMGTVSEGGTYDYGTEIQIYAMPYEHYHFVQWNDGNTDNPRTIVATENATYTATFAINQYEITVSSADEEMGTVYGSGIYNYGSVAIIMALANDGYEFVSWNDENTDNPRQIMVTEEATFIATFDQEIVPVIYYTFSETACGRYIWNGQTYSESGEYYQTFTTANSTDSIVRLDLVILPVPEPEITVDGILDACNPETASVTLSTGEYTSYIWSNGETTSSIVVTTPDVYYVEVVDSIGCHGVSEMATVGYSSVITEAPWIKRVGMSNSGTNIISWGVTSNTGITGFEVYRENTEADVYTCIARIDRPGARLYNDITSEPSARAYRYKICAVDECGGRSPMSDFHKTMHLTINRGLGTTWNLIWSHYEGLEFSTYRIYAGTEPNSMSMVVGEIPSNLNSFTDINNTLEEGMYYRVEVVMNRVTKDDEISLSSNIVANEFVERYSVVALSNNANFGTVYGGGTYPALLNTTLYAEPNDGYEFVSWSDGNTDNPRLINVTGDAIYVATFAESAPAPVETYTITAVSANPEYGTVTGGGSYSAGTVITLNAEANDGYRFVQWSDGNTDNPREITVMENAVYVAYFTENPPAPAYTITAVSANPEHGSVTGSGTYPEGAVISIEAIANEGYEFISWNDNIIDNPREITVTSDAMYIATFVPVTDIAENAVPEISVYPNPVEDILNITSSVEITEIEIVNVMGQIVLRKDVNSDSTVCNVAGLPSGVYMVRIYSRPFAPSANAQGANAQGTAVLRKFVKE